MLHSMHEHLQYESSALCQGFMSVAKYEVRYHELSRYATMILPMEYERILCFVRGLRL